ncbi:MAG TPA: 30S ribosomal protein S3 [Candidatus Akkermansia intestinigallinarum]|uniref:Small ribosomal subunit protein uS3 n=1 Tax=Candidatus Akkermansia intestinigallinarum TaxID=2838431 RepID=A0A9D1VAV0_9BACT|nr:30S ribosomal protein S3 [Candidatus Akkermansia intestinigallinarum]
MGQKVNPIGFRLAVTKDWRSKWYATGKDYATKLHEDLKIRKFIKDFTAKLNSDLKGATPAISRITIERAWNSVRVTIATARPGLVIGPKGKNIEEMTAALAKLCGGAQVKLDIMEIRQPELDAQLVAENIATQLERRVSFRRAMKRAVQVAMDFGAEGIRVRCAGRLGGADIARAEQYREGKVPLQTLRAPIDYGFAEARTLYGVIGVKCWINKRPELAGSAPSGRNNRPQRQRRDRGERRDA